MTLEGKMKTSVLNDLAETCLAIVFLVGWLLACVAAAFLLRIVPARNLSDKLDDNSVRRHFRKHLLWSKTALTNVPKALGI